MNRFHLVPRQRLLSPGNNLLNAFLLYLYTNLFHCHAVVRKQKFLCGESCKKKTFASSSGKDTAKVAQHRRSAVCSQSVSWSRSIEERNRRKGKGPRNDGRMKEGAAKMCKKLTRDKYDQGWIRNETPVLVIQCRVERFGRLESEHKRKTDVEVTEEEISLRREIGRITRSKVLRPLIWPLVLETGRGRHQQLNT